MHIVTDRDEAQRLLRLYVRDHDGASAGGVRLVHRCHQSNRGTAFESGLAELDTAIRQDRAELSKILQQLRVRPSRPRQALAWCAATAGGLKLNGHLLTYSPLSRVVEIEALSAAVTAKLCLWTALADLSTTDGRLDESTINRLQHDARTQLDSLAGMHRRATGIAFANDEEPRH